MQIDRRTSSASFAARNAGDVVDVRVRQQDVLHLQVVVADGGEQLVHLVAGIDQHALAASARIRRRSRSCRTALPRATSRIIHYISYT